MDELAVQSLELVNRELSSTLETARAEIEDYVDGQADSEALVRAASMLHLVAGALKIVEIHGAAMLAEEMEQTCHAIHDDEGANPSGDAAEALTRAMIQLPAYLERLMSGGNDVALVLLPLLNDLRAARNLPMLSEGTVLLLNTGPFEKFRHQQPDPAEAARFSSQMPALAQRLRPKFQTALLNWIRGNAGDHNISELIAVADELEAAAESEPVRQLWAVTAGVLVAVQNGDFDSSVALKRLIGQADRQLRRLIESGEQAFVSSPPVDLMNSLLYYLARATSDDPRIADLRLAFGVDTTIPDADEIEQAREDMAGPSVKLMRTVAEAIREDLGDVKDVLDIFVRTGMDNMADLRPQLDMLKKIGDTLGVLGLETARSRIQAEAEQLAGIVAANEVNDASVLEGIAASLLDVEDMLDQELVASGQAERPGEEGADQEPDSTQFRHVTAAVMRECIVNLAKIKEVVVRVLDEPESLKALDQVEPQMRGIVAGLLMLNKNRAVNVIERIGRTITTRLAPGKEALKPSRIERLADAIVSIEYYMETLALGRSDPFYMLDNANRCLDLLDTDAADDQFQTQAEKAQAAAAEAEAQARAIEETRHLSVMNIDEESGTPELVEVFIEEAKEETQKIRESLRLWVDQPEDQEALIAVRRSFHTLKGSGRVIGAELIGEFAWSVENLLNRIINHTLSATQPVFDLVSEATDVLPALVEQLEIGIPPAFDVNGLIARAEALAEGRVIEAVDEVETPVDESAVAAMDPVLQQIFVKEVRQHLGVIHRFIAVAAHAPPPVPVTEALYRACHTLFGSAKMADCEPAIDLTQPVERETGRAFESRSGLGDGSVAALGRFAGELERLCAALEAGDAFSADEDVIASLGSLAAVLPAPKPAADTAAPPAAATPTATESVSAPPEEPPADLVADYDPEIAAIFCEEASELLDHAETELQTLRDHPHSSAALGELKRGLHTLKGGARLAGIATMGDLSHALETLIPKISGAGNQDAGLKLIQQGLDRLHQMRDAVDAGHAAHAASDLIAVFENFSDFPSETEATSLMPAPRFEAPPDEAASPPAGTAGVSADAAAAPTAGEGPPAADEMPPQVSDLPEVPVQAETPAAPAAPATPAVTEAPPLPVQPAEAEPGTAAPRAERAEIARVDAALLDELLNEAGEISIFQSRLKQQVQSVEFHLGELGQTVTRLREQLRGLEAETEAQILHRHQGEISGDQQFDPLELDRYSTIQQLSRALAETSNDVASINELLQGLMSEADTLLTQQTRVATDLQDGLMQTRMVSFDRHASRLARIVRQVADETGKDAELTIEGAQSQLDRQILDAIVPALEHLLRNAVVHGIESKQERAAAGKPATGQIRLGVRREGAEVLIEVSDDGAGLDTQAIRRRALEQGLLRDTETLVVEDLAELILLPGFSTADELTQAAGRGVGMDVVDNEVKRLGGSLRIDSDLGKGTNFRIRLPYTLAITHALIVNVGDETFALPLPSIEGIARVRREELLDILTQDDPRLVQGDGSYRVQHLGSLVGGPPSPLPEEEGAVSLVLVRAGENSAALLTDSLEGSREIIVKTLGAHIASVDGVTGATILGDGRVVVILDAATLVRALPGEVPPEPAEPEAEPGVLAGLVVDDSITMRRVTQRLLERRGVRVYTARDGLDAIEVLREHDVDFIVLDIEMPRMDGYQFATHVRNDAKTRDLPIIMVTSRSGEKHRARAIEIGVNDYLSKPYPEAQLISAIEALVGRSL